MSSDKTHTKKADGDAMFVRYAVLALLIVAAFFASYKFAVASRTPDANVQAATVASGLQSDSSAACACCGTDAGSSTPVEGAAEAGADGVQRITVNTDGSYDPNVIKLAAGVPAEITFKAASGCMGQVMSDDLGFYEYLTTGDKTVKLDGLSAGTYGFSCGMQMVFGQIVVE